MTASHGTIFSASRGGVEAHNSGLACTVLLCDPPRAHVGFPWLSSVGLRSSCLDGPFPFFAQARFLGNSLVHVATTNALAPPPRTLPWRKARNGVIRNPNSPWTEHCDMLDADIVFSNTAKALPGSVVRSRGFGNKRWQPQCLRTHFDHQTWWPNTMSPHFGIHPTDFTKHTHNNTSTRSRSWTSSNAQLRNGRLFGYLAGHTFTGSESSSARPGMQDSEA